MSNWKPTESPYRVRLIYQAGPQLCGWSDTVKTYATLDEAVAAASKPFGRGCIEAHIHFAENAETWGVNGRWAAIGFRKRKQPLKLKTVNT